SARFIRLRMTFGASLACSTLALRRPALLLAHHVDEAREEIMAVLRAGGCLGVVLDRKDRFAFNAQSAIRSVEKRDVRFDDALRQTVAIDGEAVVHRDDLDLVRREVLHRM